MKRNALIPLSLILLCGIAAPAQTPSSSRNYVVATTVKVPGKKSVSQLAVLPVDSANRTIQYFDGLGRPIQTIEWQGSPGKKDIVQLNVYDALGREAVKYLPYAESSSNDGTFKSSGMTNQNAFYGSSSWDATVPKTPFPYTKTIFEPSPLNRALEQGVTGSAWQPYDPSITNSGHTTKIVNGTNRTNEVLLWEINSSGASATANYLQSTLYKTILKDENWVTGKAGTIEEFKDFEQRVILKRIWKTETDSLSTYFVYDDLNNLRYVIPPAVTLTSFTESDTIFKDFIYGYHYDGRGRNIEKKIPAKGWEHVVYNKLDQATLVQDSSQRVNNEWSFTKYDALGRLIISGIVGSSATRTSWQARLDTLSNLWEDRDNLNSNGTNTGYTNLSLPNSGITEYSVINYFDNYDFFNNTFGSPSAPLVSGGHTRGLSTGSRVNTLGSATLLLSVSYYDIDGRLKQSKSQNHLGGTDIVDNTYDFTGKLVAGIRTHSANSNTTTIAVNYRFDHADRK